MKRETNFVSGKNLKIGGLVGLALLAVLACSSVASAQHWQAATQFPGSGAGTAILTTEGHVLVQELTGPASSGGYATGNWYIMDPDYLGNYDTGIWFGPYSSGAYAPLYFASAVLPGGGVLIEGGEYNGSSLLDTTRGALWNGVFTPIGHPSGWGKIGDAPSVVLPNGKFMMGDCCSAKQAIFNAETQSWTSTGAGKADNNSEEGWTLLPSGKVLTVDTQNGTESELYNPGTGKWSLAGKLPVQLAFNCDNSGIVPEIGPAVLRPDGTVFATGANGFTAIYNASTKKWSKGPVFPPNSAGLGQDGVADGPAALLPNGNVLVMASNINPCNIPPSDFYVFDGADIDPVPGPPNASNEVSFDGRMLELPTGHILFTDGTSDVEIFYPDGSPKSSWAPTITSAPSTIETGGTYTLKGTQFNGLSQGAAYGDDAQMATNFPLVLIEILGYHFYLPTHDFTSGVATGTKTVSTKFDVIGQIGTLTGPATIAVQVNGITSNAVKVTVK